MDSRPSTLHFLCGRLASGKTTLARKIAAAEPAILLCEDLWLSRMSDGIRGFNDYLLWSSRCRAVMGPLVVDLLRAGNSVVLDFAGNTPGDRAWVRTLFESAGAAHVLHLLDAPEELCLARLMCRNRCRPEGLYFAATTEDEFHAINRFFRPPTRDEGFNLAHECPF